MLRVTEKEYAPRTSFSQISSLGLKFEPDANLGTTNLIGHLDFFKGDWKWLSVALACIIKLIIWGEKKHYANGVLFLWSNVIGHRDLYSATQTKVEVGGIGKGCEWFFELACNKHEQSRIQS